MYQRLSWHTIWRLLSTKSNMEFIRLVIDIWLLFSATTFYILVVDDVRFVFIPNCFFEGSCFVNVICIYLHILVSNTIVISDEVGLRHFTVTRWMSLVESEPQTLPEHLNSHRLSGIYVSQSFVSCVIFVDHGLSFSLFSIGYCIVSVWNFLFMASDYNLVSSNLYLSF